MKMLLTLFVPGFFESRKPGGALIEPAVSKSLLKVGIITNIWFITGHSDIYHFLEKIFENVFLALRWEYNFFCQKMTVKKNIFV